MKRTILQLLCIMIIGQAGAQQMTDLLIHYEADKGSLNRFYSIDNSPEKRERLKVFNKDYLQQLSAVNFDALSAGARVDYVLLRRDLQEQLRTLDEETVQYGQLTTWFPLSDKIYASEKERRRGTKQDAQALATTFREMALALQEKGTQLTTTTDLNIYLLRRGAAIAKGLTEALHSIHTFYNGYDPLYTWWVPAPYKQLDSTLKSYTAVWEQKIKTAPGSKDDGSGIVGHPIGREELVRQLQNEMIPYSPEELIDIANKEFAFCDAEMLKASEEMGFGKDWQKAMEKVKNSYVPAGDQPEAMMKLYNESVSFLKTNKLVTLPPLAEETWRMIMMTPERQLVNPFFTGGEEFSISYPTNDMEEADKMMSMRGNNPHFSRATVHHELLAGHALQEFMTNRYKTYRHFETPFWIEGWALYWEMLLWDMKFPQSPEDRVGMLFWRKHRCARIIFSLNYHLGKWSPQQCIDFLVDRVGHERANAVGEVRRSFVGGYSPLYQVAYMIGGLQFMALKRELVDSGKMTYQQYHDAILKENMLPVELLRSILTDKPIAKDFKTSWRFYKL
ncbi:Uncharacterized conserved protein, DUF885 familyt [Chitinophaga sp. CF118]|uniref:DUF885 family protein n=1 Tax=Chitinophaga sp. CF118 TaxID=1884367 RepID=UPI0008E1E11E|nr:DUF885 family protein [Chitinophaga sp. CF118]SFD56477.1 Uncharacterized conserved protein, DUF885 familyt [Chitinophaga sp. CF118]